MRRSSVPETRDRDGRWRELFRRAAATTIALALAGGFAGLTAGPAVAEEDPSDVAAVVTSDPGRAGKLRL